MVRHSKTPDGFHFDSSDIPDPPPPLEPAKPRGPGNPAFRLPPAKPMKPKKRQVGVYLPIEEWCQLRDLATNRGITMSDLLHEQLRPLLRKAA